MSYLVETIKVIKIFKRGIGFVDTLLHPFRNKEEILVLDNLSLKVANGEILGIIGANGSGKTTLLKILASLILPTSGEMLIRGSVGLAVGGERSFYWRLTGRQNLEFFAALYGFSGKERKQKIQYLSKLLEIEKLLDVMFQEYSAGYKQRLSIVRSLLLDPDILLLDEPLKSLDASYAQNIKDFIKKELIERQGKTIIFVVPNQEEAFDFASKLAVIEKGHINFIC